MGIELRVRVESDGDRESTRVVDESTGEEITNVSMWGVHLDSKSEELWGVFKIKKPSLSVVSNVADMDSERSEASRSQPEAG